MVKGMRRGEKSQLLFEFEDQSEHIQQVAFRNVLAGVPAISEALRIRLEPRAVQESHQAVPPGLAKELEVSLLNYSTDRHLFVFVRVEVKTICLKDLVLVFGQTRLPQLTSKIPYLPEYRPFLLRHGRQNSQI